MEKISSLPDKIIEYSFYLLFFFVPLILTPWNYELFEYNKIMLTYGLTIIIAGAWFGKSILAKKFRIQRTPLDLPILIFLISQLLSFYFSIDRHVSIWGYYSRFNGGLLSTVSYILLYYAFVTNFPREKLAKLFSFILTSGALVALYGILEHFGIDKNIWLQDVQNRVFSTLGQPNWLAAYLVILLPITIALALKSQVPSTKIQTSSKLQAPKSKLRVLNLEFGIWDLFGAWNLKFWILALLFYLCLLFTKSRSGFLGFWASYAVFWPMAYLSIGKNIKKIFLLFTSSFLLLTFIFGSPFSQLNRATLPQIFQAGKAQVPPPSLSPEFKITESSEIRNIVWKGAVEVARHYPLFGSGVETFAFSYYQFRPKEHNLTSEWDFLYNKAHNEYLNYAATTGFFGLGAYLLLIGSFVWWNIKNLKYQISNIKSISNIKYQIGIFAGYASILITNFFGFSVVIVNLFFFLIPAISFLLLSPPPQGVNRITPLRWNRSYTLGTCLFILFVICYLLFVISRMWYADTLFSRASALFEAQKYQEAYPSTKQAVNLFPSEPIYRNQYSQVLANLSLTAFEAQEATLSQTLANMALSESDKSLTISPFNVNFWKARTKVFYTLGQIEESFFQKAIEALLVAKNLSPTDPKITYNLGLLQNQIGDKKAAISAMEETIELKPDYRDAHFALSLFYKESGFSEKAREELKYILEKINPMDEEAKKKLEEWK